MKWRAGLEFPGVLISVMMSSKHGHSLSPSLPLYILQGSTKIPARCAKKTCSIVSVLWLVPFSHHCSTTCLLSASTTVRKNVLKKAPLLVYQCRERGTDPHSGLWGPSMDGSWIHPGSLPHSSIPGTSRPTTTNQQSGHVKHEKHKDYGVGKRSMSFAHFNDFILHRGAVLGDTTERPGVILIWDLSTDTTIKQGPFLQLWIVITIWTRLYIEQNFQRCSKLW